MAWRATALISPGFRRRKIPRELLLDPPKRRRRWWLWASFAVALAGGVLVAFEAVAESASPGAGILMFESPAGERLPAVHINTQVDIKVTGIVARTEVVQSFTNQTGEWQEAVYVFPLPEKAAVNFMQMQVGERLITARVEERETAKRVYEQARAEGRKAALTEQERANLFTQSVANIAPGEKIEIRLRYIESARYADGTFSLRVPLTITPRYIPGHGVARGADGGGRIVPVASVPDAARITPPMTEGHAESWRANVSAELDAGFELAEITSDYHRIVPERRGDRFVVRQSSAVAMDRDFVLRWRPVAGASPTAAFFGEHVDGKDHGLLMVLPPAAMTSRRLPRDMIFVVDTSGSMKGASMRQARQALERALRLSLSPQDRFNIIEFDNRYTMLFGESAAVDAHTLRQANAFVGELEADGGTEMAAPLGAALDARSEESHLKHIVFITDGAVGNEGELFDMIHRKLGEARLFTVGIGSAPNSYFMRKAAEFGRGTFTYIGDTAEVAERVDRLLEKLERPIARNVRIDWHGSTPPSVFPQRLPALYDGEPLLVVARSDYLTGDVEISATVDGNPWSKRLPVSMQAGGSGIGTLWAREKIEALGDERHRGGDEDRIREEVIDVAMAHQLVSRYTSLVAVESMISRMPGDSQARAAVPNRIAKGQVVALPGTSTHASLVFLIGCVSLFLAILCWFICRREAA